MPAGVSLAVRGPQLKDASDEGTRSVQLWRGQDLVRRSLFDDLAGIHENDLARNITGKCQFMGDDDRGAAFDG